MRLAAILGLLAVSAAVAPAAEWRLFSTPDFELYTDAGEKAGRDTIRYFSQVRGFFEKAAPVRFPADFPVRVIVFRTSEEFAPYALNGVNTAFYASAGKRDYIVLANPSAETYSIAVHEYMHLIIRRSGLHIPVWLNEGLADVYSTLRPVRDGVAVGDLIPGRIQPLADGRWLPFDVLTGATARSPEYNEADRVGVFYAESWALAHMLFLSPEYSGGFARFFTALNRGKTSAEACEIAYGKTSAQVFADLQKYFSGRKLYGRVFETALGSGAAEADTKLLSEFDSRLMLADLLASTGRLDRARAEYLDLEQREPRRLEVVRSLGYLAMAAHDPKEARAEFEKAFAAGDSDPRMCVDLAVLQRDANDSPAKTLAVLDRALQSRPGYTDAVIQKGITQIRMSRFNDAAATLMSIENVTPEQALIVFSSLAYAYLETGDLTQARVNALRAQKWTRTDAAAQSVAKLLGIIDARAKSPLAPYPGEELQRVAGVVRNLDCTRTPQRFLLTAGVQTITFLLPEADAVEMSRPGGGAVQLACGRQKPLEVAVYYAPASPIETDVAGIVRRLEFK